MDARLIESKIKELLEEKEAFLVECSVTDDARIHVEADTPAGITLGELSELSRALEERLNRDEEDFELTLTSPGVGKPLRVPQQYAQNVGRKVKLLGLDGQKKEARLTHFEDGVLTLEWKQREPKPVGKGKRTVTKQEQWPLKEVKEVTVEIEF